MTSTLTPRQRQILDLLRDSLAHNGFGMTLQEIADELGVTKMTVFEHVKRLKANGYLERKWPHTARALRLTKKAIADRGFPCPHCGRPVYGATG